MIDYKGKLGPDGWAHLEWNTELQNWYSTHQDLVESTPVDEWHPKTGQKVRILDAYKALKGWVFEWLPKTG